MGLGSPIGSRLRVSREDRPAQAAAQLTDGLMRRSAQYLRRDPLSFLHREIGCGVDDGVGLLEVDLPGGESGVHHR